jgi:hypothetical protein
MQSLLATRFSRSTTRVQRTDQPMGEDQMRAVAPSIFAEGKHASRSQRYTHIPTIDVLRGLDREGFKPFMVAQAQSRVEGKTAFTKHMIRLRHADQVNARDAANEIILINSHDGASAYQMLAGMFRFVCHNGLIAGQVCEDIRIPHKGNISQEVIEGAFRVLGDFEAVNASADGMKALSLEDDEQAAFAAAALALRFGDRGQDGQPPAPITAGQLNQANRPEDGGPSLWATLQRVQENATRGGQIGRSVQGHRLRTRAVNGIDGNVSLNRALWVLAEEMKKLKA